MLQKYILVLLFVLINNLVLNAQMTDVQPAGFDVIVKTNGEIIYGKVVEVSRTTGVIRYQRTDIPDGPVYELFWDEIYAISYRNQLTEYFVDPDWVEESPFRPFGEERETESMETDDEVWYSGIRDGELRIGFGFIRQFSRVSEVDDYRTRDGFPAMAVTYTFPLVDEIEIGTSVSWASFKYSDRTFSEYDQLLTNNDITEALFSFALLARYYIDLDLFRPYVMGGLAFTNSSVRTDGKVTFTDDERSVLIQGGARSGSFGIPLRAGFDVRFSERVGGYIDIGNGMTLLQIGGVFKF